MSNDIIVQVQLDDITAGIRYSGTFVCSSLNSSFAMYTGSLVPTPTGSPFGMYCKNRDEPITTLVLI